MSIYALAMGIPPYHFSTVIRELKEYAQSPKKFAHKYGVDVKEIRTQIIVKLVSGYDFT